MIWNLLFGSKRKKKKSAKDAPPKKARVILIDQRNIELAGVEPEEGETYILPRRIDWSKFRHVLEAHSADVFAYDRKSVFARVFPPRDPRHARSGRTWLERTKHAWKEHGYEFTPRKEKDVDSWIVSEMWGAADTAWNTHHCSEIHFVIASGDGVFARELERLVAQYAGRMHIVVTVFSWHGGFNQQWLELTNAHNVILLDSADVVHADESSHPFDSRRVVS